MSGFPPAQRYGGVLLGSGPAAGLTQLGDPTVVDGDDFQSDGNGLLAGYTTRAGTAYSIQAVTSTGAPTVYNHQLIRANADGSVPNTAAGTTYACPGFAGTGLTTTPDAYSLGFVLSSTTYNGRAATTDGQATGIICFSTVLADISTSIITDSVHLVVGGQSWALEKFVGGVLSKIKVNGVGAFGTFAPALPYGTLLTAEAILVGSRLVVRLPNGQTVVTDPDPDIPSRWGPYMVLESLQPATNSVGLAAETTGAGTQLNTVTTLTTSASVNGAAGYSNAGGTARYGLASDGATYGFAYTSITTVGAVSTFHGVTWPSAPGNTVQTAAGAFVSVPAAFATDHTVIISSWTARSYGMAQASAQSTSRQYLTKSANYTLATTDQFVLFTGAGLTATLADATKVGTGYVQTIGNFNTVATAGVNTVTVAAVGGTVPLTVLYPKSICSYISDGTNWQVYSLSNQAIGVATSLSTRRFGVSTKTANYTLAYGTDDTVFFNNTNLTATLPGAGSAATGLGVRFIVGNLHATALTVASASTINAPVSLAQFATQTYVSDGTNWNAG